jgi:hypothetical protein
MYILSFKPNVLRVADAIHHTGLTTPDAIRIVADVWRNTTPETLTRQQVRDVNIQTLTRLEQEGFLRRASQDTYATVANEWHAPLYPLDLRKSDVRPADLREAQEQWVPPDYY